MRSDPVLPSADLDDTIEFYRSLGFTLGYDDRDEDGYIIMSMDGASLHFFYHDALDATGNESVCYLNVPDALAVHERWSALGLGPDDVPSLGELEDKPWGKREFSLVDPDGNVLRVGHDVPAAG